MIERYSLHEMKQVWEPENKFNKWLAIEVLACEALAQKGEIPESAVRVIKEKGQINTERINEIELDVKHDVIAFLTAVSESIGDEAKYLHLGLTSSDVLDTGLALQLMDASDIILDNLNRLLDVLKDKAHVYKNTVMIGRSHGIHAEPVTFGLKMALWYEETKRNIDRLIRARETIAYGKISGAVGPFTKGQKGSSAMPHKRNPVGCENISGLARIVRSNCIAALENIPLWHERDISHSSVERVIMPDSTILIDYMLNRLINIIKDLVVYPDNMAKNLNLTGGLIFSQRVLLELIRKGMERDKAYRLVQRNAMEAWKTGSDFQKLLMMDGEVMAQLSEEDIRACFDLSYNLRHFDHIFKRVFQ